MLAADWVELLKKMTPEDQEQLVFSTSNGVEIAAQRILRIEEKYLVVRGRLGGTSDEPRIYCLPLETLIFLGFGRAMTEDRLKSIFGELMKPAKESKMLDAQASEPGPEASAPDAASAEKPSNANADLLARLRVRAGQSKGR